MVDQDEEILKLIITRYQSGIFALVLYLTGGDREKAYDITASSFVKVLSTFSVTEESDKLLTGLARVAVEKCRDVKAVPASDKFNFKPLTFLYGINIFFFFF